MNNYYYVEARDRIEVGELYLWKSSGARNETTLVRDIRREVLAVWVRQPYTPDHGRFIKVERVL